MFNFLKFQKLYFAISTIVIGFGLYSIVTWGYHYSIDFVGGSNIEYRSTKPLKSDLVEKIVKTEKGIINDISIVDTITIIQVQPLDEKQELKIRTSLEAQAKVKIELLRFETVGPTLGKETMNKTIIASILALMGILIYMSFAFKGLNFALAAILAMVHDFLVVIGSYSLLSHYFGAQLDTLFVTAVLTTMSFSVHDTIVIFDKIREYINTEGRGNIDYYANRALTETMVRSLNNSMTIVFMLLSLILLGGSMIKFFVLTLLIGTITGTYSSPFIATSILVWLEKRKNR
ncbi:protein-export membrane protein SecF [Candidatus Roizmanbacteria bacterium CG2_30_33_16]|uniref:Protein-export membrane protein SecF n=4 Tax=Candidatus Roizmaniibacteriota TaxID=1752723 RepID=A0A2M7E584_9BACT|nr:protein translocase subunit SecF [Candidatus Roizmanbacteria bacterium]OIP84521.1 MAG: protein-export membrane protein SecF [Candidatus Roizmanbacteria bacterium CG2_30_33_16]PIV62884.1 MAG: protein translocase subunit SecF [Candidatus Roizmanbacteria bacterium CG01_land_8_20_14_3_00_33_9]PIX70633.1 MAG: protein translocase subunit SecF [Candidatus Roizmanbacteria bacterium CG_4_10_14_3_um_filter_33_21]PJB87693.1 MAG: protein translocase subunit SecF [Candidatus Roizmanbacteria bacterium CG_